LKSLQYAHNKIKARKKELRRQILVVSEKIDTMQQAFTESSAEHNKIEADRKKKESVHTFLTDLEALLESIEPNKRKKTVPSMFR
jgi:hypothetical protein